MTINAISRTNNEKAAGRRWPHWECRLQQAVLLLRTLDERADIMGDESSNANDVVPFDALISEAEKAEEAEEAEEASDNDEVKSKVSVDLEELQDIKIRTMYRMVKEVDLSATTGRPNQPATFLYLTNKQAHAVTVPTIPRLLEEMNIVDIEMVIYLTTSVQGKASLRSFPPVWGHTGHAVMNLHDARIGLRVRWLPPVPREDDAIFPPLPGSWGTGEGEWAPSHSRWKKQSLPREKGLDHATYPGRVVAIDREDCTCTVEWDADKSRHAYRIGKDGQYDLAFHNEQFGLPWHMSDDDEFMTEVQFDKFINDVLLPVAAAHRALIVFTGLNYCGTIAQLHACTPTQRRAHGVLALHAHSAPPARLASS